MGLFGPQFIRVIANSSRIVKLYLGGAVLRICDACSPCRRYEAMHENAGLAAPITPQSKVKPIPELLVGDARLEAEHTYIVNRVSLTQAGWEVTLENDGHPKWEGANPPLVFPCWFFHIVELAPVPKVRVPDEVIRYRASRSRSKQKQGRDGFLD